MNMKLNENIENIKLTKYAKSAGCAAKLEPGILGKILKEFPRSQDENLLIGLETSDDAAVYRISDEVAMVQTLDFFPPMVDDPYTFGQIAAANALSDIYAMGGNPVTALNIVAYPNCLGDDTLSRILKGGADKVNEAGGIIAGGHSINDDEPKYGLSVTGFVKPDRVWSNKGSKVGDVLILTKPLGTGLINTAVKAEMAYDESVQEAIYSMSMLNKTAKEIAQDFTINACTDITGFGLVGHSLEMAVASNVNIKIDTQKIPVLRRALEYAQMGLVPEGTYRNRKYSKSKVDFTSIDEEIIDLICDPQTSGGLLLSVPQEQGKELLERLKVALPKLRPEIIGSVCGRDKADKHNRDSECYIFFS
ncbi:MAG: selenide, water dikinase SelD [Aminipila sp.]